MTFDLPEDYQVPQGIEEGETFKEIATFKVENGKVTIVSMGEDECPVKSSESKSKPKPKGAKASIDEALEKGDTEEEM